MRLRLKDLPGYLNALKKRGQIEVEDVPVVDMGSIGPRRSYKPLVLALSACLLLCLFTYRYSMRSIVISGDRDVILSTVSESGGRVFSVSEGEDGYVVRVFSFRPDGLVDRLRKKFDKVELKD